MLKDNISLQAVAEIVAENMFTGNIVLLFIQDFL